MAGLDIEWYGPKRGKRSVEGIVSNMPGTVSAVRDKARSMASEAWVLLQAHKAAGHYSRSAHPRIRVGGSRTGLSLDWYVYLEADSYVKEMGPQRKNAADAAAMGIEFGGGRAFGKGNNRTAGLHILGRVIARNVGKF